MNSQLGWHRQMPAQLLLEFHPCGDSIPLIVLKSNTKGAITVESALFGELHGREGLFRSDAFVI